MIDLVKANVSDNKSDLHCEDSQNDQVVTHFPLNNDSAVGVGVVIGQGWVWEQVPEELSPAPLFCMCSPVTQYLKGLFNWHSLLITKSMRLLIDALAFSFE